MKIAKIKETGAEIPVREVNGGYQSYPSENIYPVDDVEIIEDTPDDFSIASEIKDLQNKISYRKILSLLQSAVLNGLKSTNTI